MEIERWEKIAIAGNFMSTNQSLLSVSLANPIDYTVIRFVIFKTAMKSVLRYNGFNTR